MTTRHRDRPKWAKPLTAAQWRHVIESTARPTLSAVERNLDYQRTVGFECRECAAIALALGNRP